MRFFRLPILCFCFQLVISISGTAQMDSIQIAKRLDSIEYTDIRETNRIVVRIFQDLYAGNQELKEMICKHSLDQVPRLLKSTPDSLLYEVYYLKVNTLNELQQLDKVLDACFEALNNIPNRSQDSLYFTFRIWDVYSHLGDASEAFRWYNIHKDLRNRLGRLEPWEDADTDLDRLYSNLGHYKRAAHYARKKAFKYVRYDNQPLAWSSHMNNIGVAYRNAAMYDSALYYFNRSYDSLMAWITIENPAPTHYFYQFQYYIRGNIGDTYVLLKEYEKAIPLLKDDLRKSFTQFSKRDQAEVMHNLSVAYLGTRKPEFAKHFLDSCQLLFEQLNDAQGIGTNLRYYAEYYYQIKDFGEYHRYNLAYLDYIESTEEMAGNLQLTAMLNLHETELKEQTIQEQKTTLEDEQQLLKQKQREINLIWLILGILIVSIFFIGFFLLKVRKQRSIVEESLKEQTVLLQEVHHRVKNNLQLVNGVLEIQSDKIEDSTLKKVFLDTRLIVKSMSTVHEILYLKKEVSRINFNQYLDDLLSHLSQSYNTSNTVEIIKDCEDIDFTLKTSVPLGLIVNELVTNAYKHAFGATDSGKIVISLRGLGMNSYELTVRDNGAGIQGAAPVNSIGMELLSGLAKQLKGTLQTENSNGLICTVIFKQSDD